MELDFVLLPLYECRSTNIFLEVKTIKSVMVQFCLPSITRDLVRYYKLSGFYDRPKGIPMSIIKSQYFRTLSDRNCYKIV